MTVKDEQLQNESNGHILPEEEQINNDLSQRTVNIRCSNIYKIFRQGKLEVVALKAVNLNIYAGEIVVIMGPSGSGKTTLLNCISGMDQVTAGQIFIRGFDITRMKDEGIQKILQNEIGIVFQFFNLIPSLTAEGNIELPMTIAKKSNKFKKTRVKELLEEIGIENRKHHRPFTLSGGEKQRVAIAMAFANDPTIILADEPTGNIDSISAEHILGIFRNFIKNNPEKSIIIVTHNPSIRKIADRTLIIKDGQIIRELGRLEEGADINLETTDDEIDKITILRNDFNDEAVKAMDQSRRIKDFKRIVKCPGCEGKNIIKSYDQKNGNFKVINNQLVTRASIYCSDCYHIYYKNVSMVDIKENFYENN
ncbi:MAG: ATP-binding cassette domain-containing protein [Promethearchaeota archaeon]